MFSGIRLYKLAVGGCLAALLFFPAAISAQENETKQQTETQQPNAGQQTPAPEPTPSVRVYRPKPVKTDWNKVECAKPQNHDEADLCEQRRMSQAAENTVWLNKIQIALGVVGAALVLLSLHYTRVAASAAVVSAKTASAAITELERPWLTVQLHPRFGGDPEEDGTIHTLFDIANHGRMPAIIVRCVGEISAAKEHPGQPKMLDQSSGVVGPSDKLPERKVFCPFFWKYDSLVSLVDDESYFYPAARSGEEIFLYLIITYRGLTDRAERTSSYCWRYDRDGYQWAEFGGGDYNRHT